MIDIIIIFIFLVTVNHYNFIKKNYIEILDGFRRCDLKCLFGFFAKTIHTN